MVPFLHPHYLTENDLTAPKRGPPCGPQNATEGGTTAATFLRLSGRALVCIVADGRRFLAGKRPRVRFHRCRNRCIHFLAAALRAGRHEAAPLSRPLWLSIANAHRLSQTNCGGGATPCALFCSPIQPSRPASSTNRCASARATRGISSLQSSHWAHVSAGVSWKWVSISRVQVSTSSSMTRAYFRSGCLSDGTPSSGFVTEGYLSLFASPVPLFLRLSLQASALIGDAS